tara:strand:- start:2533 stop:3492 length:960 start_codon:yes stop_codon:yes gene_type:complete
MENENINIRVSKKLIIGVVIVAIVAIGAFFLIQDSQSDVAAVVNGEIITIEELSKTYDSLPEQYKPAVTKESLLKQLIQAKVIYQEAEKQGAVVTTEQAEQMFQQAKSLAGLTEEQFAANIEAQGITEEELIDQYREQLTVQNFIEENLLNKIEVSEDDIQEYYESNDLQFEVGEQVVVKHILIGDSDLSAEQKREKAEGLLIEVNKINFCDYVSEHSTDTLSVENCGEETFTQEAPYVEEFKKLSFDQNAGKIGIADTQYGSHIIWTVKKIPSRTLKLDEVKDKIAELLKSEEGQEQFDSFYEELSKDSEIEILYIEN